MSTIKKIVSFPIRYHETKNSWEFPKVPFRILYDDKGLANNSGAIKKCHAN